MLLTLDEEYRGVRRGLRPPTEAMLLVDPNPVNADPHSHAIQSPRDSVQVAGGAVSEPQIIHLFDTREAFAVWARSTRFAAAFDHIEEIIARTRERKDIVLEDGPSSQYPVQVIANSPIDREWAKLIVPPSKLESNATIWEDQRFSGHAMATGPCAIDDLSDIDFYKNISSMKVRGVCLLTDLRYFGGTRFYITGDPLVEVPDLAVWSFLRRAASAIVV